MSLISFRDPNDQPIVYLSVRLGKNDETVDQCPYGHLTDTAGNASFNMVATAPYYADARSFTLYCNYTDVLPILGTTTLIVPNFDQDYRVVVPWASSGGGGGGNGQPPNQVTIDRLRGASLYGQGGDPEWDFRTFAHILSDCGLNWTCWWLWGGWRDDGTSGSSYPFLRSGGPGSKWDLMRPNHAYFDRQEEMVDYYRSYGIRPLINFVDLYPWSEEKAHLPGIPDPNQGPFRFNVNGVRWGMGPGSHPDDPFYLEQPHGGPETGPNWLEQFIEQIVGLIGDKADYQTGNECPESGLHDRIRDVIKRVCPTAKTTCSRNNDSPGQYYNMVKTHRHDAINFHGWKDMARMVEIFEEEHNPDTGRPDSYTALFDALSGNEPRQVIACSDGARSNQSNYPYNLPELFKAFEFAWQHGANIDHQSGAKMVLYNEGRHDLSFVEVEFLKKLAAL